MEGSESGAGPEAGSGAEKADLCSILEDCCCVGLGITIARALAVSISYTLGVRSIVLGGRPLKHLSATRSRRAARGTVVILSLSMFSQAVPDISGRCLDLAGSSVRDTSVTPPDDVPPGLRPVSTMESRWASTVLLFFSLSLIQ